MREDFGGIFGVDFSGMIEEVVGVGVKCEK